MSTGGWGATSLGSGQKQQRPQLIASAPPGTSRRQSRHTLSQPFENRPSAVRMHPKQAAAVTRDATLGGLGAVLAVRDVDKHGSSDTRCGFPDPLHIFEA